MGRGSWQTRTLVALVAVLAASLCVIVSRPLTTLPWASVGVLAEPSSVSPACGAVRAVVPSSSNDTVHVAHAICGGYGRDGKGAHFYAFTVIKSALMARARSAAPDRRMHFHVVVDGSMANILRDRAALLVSHPGIADVLDYVANHTGGRVSLTLYADSDVEHAVTASVGATDAGAITLGLFRHCSTARLKLPFAPQLANASRLLYVDYDSVVLCDLALLWDTFDWGGGGALMAATTEMAHVGQPSMYRGMPAAFGAAGGLNAGVLFMHLDRMRAVGLPRIWAEMAAITRARGYEAPEFANVSKGPQHTTDGLPFGDQDILNILAFRHPEWFRELDQRWNWRQSSHATRGVDLRVNAPPGYVPPVPCIEHYAGMQGFGNNVAVPQRQVLYAYVAYQRLLASGGDDMPVIQTCMPGCEPQLMAA